jgi:transcriptional regulator with XRE-family HTH domain
MKLSRASVGFAIRAARDAAGLTLRDLAGLTGISHTLLGRTELGERDVGYLELLAIAEAVKLDELTLREYAKTFERDGLPEQRQIVRDANRLQRLAIEALVADKAAVRR